MIAAFTRNEPHPPEIHDLARQLTDTQAAGLHQGLQRATLRTWPCRTDTPPTAQADAFGGSSPCPVQHDADVQGLRLHELRGPVVRIAQLTEYHVNNPALVLATASASGWQGEDLSERAEHDPEDLAGAIAWLTEEAHAPIAGTDILTDELLSTALSLAACDEVASWSRTPVIADFGSGWQHNEPTPYCQPDPAEPLPDFARLFPLDPRPKNPDQAPWQLTPRTAAVMYETLLQLSDEALDDAEELGDTNVTRKLEGSWQIFSRLPKETWNNKKQWRIGFAHCFEKLAEDLATGTTPTPTGMSEEALALWLALHEAPAAFPHLQDREDYEALPRHRHDHTWLDYSYTDQLD